MLRASLILLALLLLTACRTTHPAGDQPVTEPLAAQTAEEEAIAVALRYAFAEMRDVPDHSLLADPERVVLAAGRMVMRPSAVLQSDGAPLPDLTPRALPETRAVQFVLLADTTIQQLADAHGAFAHARVGAVTMTGARATVEVATEWAVPRESDTLYLSGGGYVLELRRTTDGRWAVYEVVGRWIS